MTKFVWSHSALECFEQCPRKFYHKYILREKEPVTDALRRGRAVHEALERYLLRSMDADIPLIEKFLPLADAVGRQAQGKRLITEHKMGLDRDLGMCAFFSGAVWGRGAADIIIYDTQAQTAFLGDWKDGKGDKPWSYVLKYENDTQLKTLALFMFKEFPKLQKITACNIWLEHGRTGPVRVFHRDNLQAMWGWMIPRIIKLEDTIAKNQWCEIPGPLCGWCPVKACAHNRS